MTSLTVFVVALLAAAAYAEKPIRLLSTEETTIFNYHTRIGVPEAKRIQLEEEQLVQDPSRIVGGSPANPSQQPFLGGLLITLANGQTSVCGASLLSNTRLATAAHCWWDGQNHGQQVLVVLGTSLLMSSGFRIVASNVQMHENFIPQSNLNDVAMITTGHIAYTNNIQNIALPTANTAPTYAGNWAAASGFGRQSDMDGLPANPEMRQVQLQVITNAVCQQTFGNNVVAASLCTSGVGGVGFCGGDSGGPLALATTGTTPTTLIGIASWTSAWGCQAGHPSVFSRVTSYMIWLRQRL